MVNGKWEREAVKRGWSCASPPPGTTQMDVRMWRECPLPGVQNGREAKLCAEIGWDRRRRRRSVSLASNNKENNLSFLCHINGEKRIWAAEDEMIVADGQQAHRRAAQPLIAGAGLAFQAITGYGRSYTIWPDARSSARIAMTTEGSARSRQAPYVAARSAKRCTVAGSCHQ